MRDGWRMLCTEIDGESRVWAQRNIEGNGLEERVRVVECDETSQTIIPVREVERFERLVSSFFILLSSFFFLFSMCFPRASLVNSEW